MLKPYILILYYSSSGHTALLAEELALGLEAASSFEVRLRTVPSLNFESDESSSVPYCSKEDLIGCAGLLLGSPSRYGAIAAPLKLFLERQGDVWLGNQLVGKPATVFASSGSLHGGQEAVLLQMITMLLHFGMLIAGVPYQIQALKETSTGGAPYGVTHWSRLNYLSEEEVQIARQMGKYFADLVQKILGLT